MLPPLRLSGSWSNQKFEQERSCSWIPHGGGLCCCYCYRCFSRRKQVALVRDPPTRASPEWTQSFRFFHRGGYRAPCRHLLGLYPGQGSQGKTSRGGPNAGRLSFQDHSRGTTRESIDRASSLSQQHPHERNNLQHKPHSRELCIVRLP